MTERLRERVEALAKEWEDAKVLGAGGTYSLACRDQLLICAGDLRAALRAELDEGTATPPGKVLACSVCGWSAEPCPHIGAWLERHGPVNEREPAPPTPTTPKPNVIRWLGDETQDADSWEIAHHPERLTALGNPATLYFKMDDGARVIVPRGWWICDLDGHPYVSSAPPATPTPTTPPRDAILAHLNAAGMHRARLIVEGLWPAAPSPEAKPPTPEPAEYVLAPDPYDGVLRKISRVEAEIQGYAGAEAKPPATTRPWGPGMIHDRANVIGAEAETGCFNVLDATGRPRCANPDHWKPAAPAPADPATNPKAHEE